ncbi:MAG: hypothetical protein BGO49_01550 [Planctomycetales bacterium 71-10]|nr:MAG: hypothetical protein BGO49_01550 [Planctomycetales bacterium 71-10]
MIAAQRTTRLPIPGSEHIYRIPVDRYERMVSVGDLDEDDRIELLNGVLTRKMTKGTYHEACSALCRREIERLLPGGFFARSEGPVRIPEYSEPEPDLSVARGDVRDYLARHPGPGDVVLAVEVADASLALDRGLKRDLYAQAGIPTYWIVNLVERRVEVFAEPKDGAYATTSVVGEGGAVELVVDGVALGRVEVAAILP